MKLIKKEIIVSLIVIVVTACITSIGLVIYHKNNEIKHNRRHYCGSAHACECKENEKTCTCSSYDLDGNEIHNVICPNNNIKRYE